MTGKELQEELTWKFPHIAKEAPEQVEEAAAFCEGYKAFLDEGKTERECVKIAVGYHQHLSKHHQFAPKPTPDRKSVV